LVLWVKFPFSWTTPLIFHFPKFLDLSFNNIAKIEGLDQLWQLTDLSLFNNRITKLENLDPLTQLNVLSVGNNELQDMSDLAYLSKFENLRLLNVSGNPLCKHPEYKGFILSRLHHLQYIDYRLIEPTAVRTLL
jgi:Leucine-rich repeat (LRR) protein